MDEIAQVGIKEFGITGLILGLAFMLLYGLGGKLISAAFEAAKRKRIADGNGAPDPEDLRRYSDSVLTQIKTDLADVKKTVKNTERTVDIIDTNGKNRAKQITRLERAVIDGNGRPGLQTQHAELNARVDAHLKDGGLHTAER